MRRLHPMDSPWRLPPEDQKAAQDTIAETTMEPINPVNSPHIPEVVVLAETHLVVVDEEDEAVMMAASTPQCNGTGGAPAVTAEAPHPSEYGEGDLAACSPPHPSQNTLAAEVMEPAGEQNRCGSSSSSRGQGPAVAGGRLPQGPRESQPDGTVRVPVPPDGSMDSLDESTSGSYEESDEYSSSSDASAEGDAPVTAITGSVAYFRQMLLRPNSGLARPLSAGDPALSISSIQQLPRRPAGSAPKEKLVSTLGTTRSTKMPPVSGAMEQVGTPHSATGERTRRVVLLASPAPSLATRAHSPLAVPFTIDTANRDAAGSRRTDEQQPSPCSFSGTVNSSDTLVDDNMTTVSEEALREVRRTAAAYRCCDVVSTVSQSMQSDDEESDESESVKTILRMTAQPMSTSQALAGVINSGRLRDIGTGDAALGWRQCLTDVSDFDDSEGEGPHSVSRNSEMDHSMPTSSHGSQSQRDRLPSSSRDSGHTSITDLSMRNLQPDAPAVSPPEAPPSTISANSRFPPLECQPHSDDPVITVAAPRLVRQEKVTALMLAESSGALSTRDDLREGASLLADQKILDKVLPAADNLAPASQYPVRVISDSVSPKPRSPENPNAQRSESVESLPHRLEPRDREVENIILRLNSRLQWEAVPPSKDTGSLLCNDKHLSQRDTTPLQRRQAAPDLLAPADGSAPVAPLVAIPPLPQWVLPPVNPCHNPPSGSGLGGLGTIAINLSTIPSITYSSNRVQKTFSWIQQVEGDSGSDDSFFEGGRSWSASGPAGTLWGVQNGHIPVSSLATLPNELRSDALVTPFLSAGAGDTDAVKQESLTTPYQSSLVTDTYFVAVSSEAQLLREVPEGLSEHCIFGARLPFAFRRQSPPVALRPTTLERVVLSSGTVDRLKTAAATPRSGGGMSSENTSDSVTSAAKQGTSAVEENSETQNLTESAKSTSTLRNKTSTESVTVCLPFPMQLQSPERKKQEVVAAPEEPPSDTEDVLRQESDSVDGASSQSLNTRMYLSSTAHPGQVHRVGQRRLKAHWRPSPSCQGENQQEEVNGSGLEGTQLSSPQSSAASVSQTRHPSLTTDDAENSERPEACSTRPTGVPVLALTQLPTVACGHEAEGDSADKPLPWAATSTLPQPSGFAQKGEAPPPPEDRSAVESASVPLGGATGGCIEDDAAMLNDTRSSTELLGGESASLLMAERKKSASHHRTHLDCRSTDSGCSSVLTLNFAPLLRRSTEQGSAPRHREKKPTRAPYIKRLSLPASRSFNPSDDEQREVVAEDRHDNDVVAQLTSGESTPVSYVDDGFGIPRPVMGKRRKNVKSRNPEAQKLGDLSSIMQIEDAPVVVQAVELVLSPRGDRSRPAADADGDDNDGWGLPAFAKPLGPRKQQAPGLPVATPTTASPNLKHGAFAKMLEKATSEAPDERRLARSVNSLPEPQSPPRSPRCITEHALPAPPRRAGAMPRAQPPSQHPAIRGPPVTVVATSGPPPPPIMRGAAPDFVIPQVASECKKQETKEVPAAARSARVTSSPDSHDQDVKPLQTMKCTTTSLPTDVVKATACATADSSNAAVKPPLPSGQQHLKTQFTRSPDAPEPEAARLGGPTRETKLAMKPLEQNLGLGAGTLKQVPTSSIAAAVAASVMPNSAEEPDSSHAKIIKPVVTRGGLRLGPLLRGNPSGETEDICTTYWGNNPDSTSESEGDECCVPQELPLTLPPGMSHPSATPAPTPEVPHAPGASSGPEPTNISERVGATHTKPSSPRTDDSSVDNELERLLGCPGKDTWRSGKVGGTPGTPRVSSNATPRSRSSSMRVLSHRAASSRPELVRSHSYHCSPRGYCTDSASTTDCRTPSPWFARWHDSPPLPHPLPACTSHVSGWSGHLEEIPRVTPMPRSPSTPHSHYPHSTEMWATAQRRGNPRKNVDCGSGGEPNAQSLLDKSLTSPSSPTSLGLRHASSSTLSWLDSKSASRCGIAEGSPRNPTDRESCADALNGRSRYSSPYEHSFRSLQQLCAIECASPMHTPLNGDPACFSASPTDWSSPLYDIATRSHIPNTQLLCGCAESPSAPVNQSETPRRSLGASSFDSCASIRNTSVTLPPLPMGHHVQSSQSCQDNRINCVSTFDKTMAYD